MEKRLCILIGRDRGRSFRLAPRRDYTVGRHWENDIIIMDKNISRNHLKIQVKGDKYLITDLHSRNGTFANGIDLVPGIETEVIEGVPIVIGKTIFCFGEDSESCLGQFLDSAGFAGELTENGEAAGLRRIMGIKNNLKFIYKVSYELMRSKDFKEIAKVLLDNILNLFKRIDRCVIILIDETTGKINNILYKSRKPDEDYKNLYNKELLEQALIVKRPVMVRDSTVIEEDEYDRVTESLQLMKIRSAMCVPILGGEGIKGAIYIDSHEQPNGFRRTDAALLKDISGRVSLAIDNVLLQMSLC